MIFTTHYIACVLFGIALGLLAAVESDIRSGMIDNSRKKMWIILILLTLSFISFNVTVIMNRRQDGPAPHRPRIKIPGDIKKGLGQKIGDTLPK